MKKNDGVRCDLGGLDGDKIIDNHMSATSMRTDREEIDLSTEHSPEYFMTHPGTLEGCERGSAFRTGHNLNLHENENENINKEFYFNINNNGNKNNNINNHDNYVNIKNESSRIDGSTINYSLGKFSPDYNGSHNPVNNINQNKDRMNHNQNHNYYNQKESLKKNQNNNQNNNQNENQNENYSESEGSALCGPSSSLIR